ncbi:hypothetical protein FM996_19805 [Methylosinus sporium]|uniref:NusG-like N-terminal domain-containing protein n=1 Tax=Methylosinus sporium TaxID=428 RepID=A0A549SDG9_METSR|nr:MULTISPECIES: transcription termination/antitermination NusG family protein [Methylosinus]MBU3890378.1 hypothetical protein [Methylosinus sp. KRF6]TRL26525.1 hypothetical protein FM996_19805 [Methylosinus sporium]
MTSDAGYPAIGQACDLTLQGDERWYVAHTLPRREISAQLHLGAQGFRHFLPTRLTTVRHARKLRAVYAPLFPRYLFIILDLGRDRWRSINGTSGVAGLVMAQDRPLAAPCGLVEALTSFSDAASASSSLEDLRPGQKVRLIAGPFADALGVLDRLDDAGRVGVLLDIMGGGIRVKLARTWIEPAA